MMGMFPVSFNWAAPEVLYDRRYEVCAKSDVWALGMVMTHGERDDLYS